jgi:hypothetical protein
MPVKKNRPPPLHFCTPPGLQRGEVEVGSRLRPADREQEQADRDYRELARLTLATAAGACRCAAVKASCLGCRVARWLAVGL